MSIGTTMYKLIESEHWATHVVFDALTRDELLAARQWVMQGLSEKYAYGICFVRKKDYEFIFNYEASHPYFTEYKHAVMKVKMKFLKAKREGKGFPEKLAVAFPIEEND